MGDDRDDRYPGRDTGTGILEKPKVETRKPSMYRVLMMNDDYTPFEFVVHVLEKVFEKGREEAHQIMMHVHKRGVGTCGVYTFEIAETKIALAMGFAKREQHPLQYALEKE